VNDEREDLSSLYKGEVMTHFPDEWKPLDEQCFAQNSAVVDIDETWMDSRLQETPVIVALPKFDANRWYSLFTWNKEDIANEHRLSEICDACGMLGWNGKEFVLGAHLLHIPSPKINDSEKYKKLGWTPEHIRQLKKSSPYIDSIHDRVRAAAGWLICHSEFVEARNKLQQEWSRLRKDQRPALPLLRSNQLQQKHPETRKARESKKLQFHRCFDQFCDEWRINAMITWELPNPDGPKWPNNFFCREAIKEGSTLMDTPFHFAIQSQDETGKDVKRLHDDLAEKREFPDQSKWKTYAQLLRLSFWEVVLDQRYRSNSRVNRYVTIKVSLLAEILGLDQERVLKLRRTLSEFRRGKRTSLRGVR
jgi:hypothetical protein